MSNEKNCTTCRYANERTTETGHAGWHCTPNDMDVNRRMTCEEWSRRTTRTQRPVFSRSVSTN